MKLPAVTHALDNPKCREITENIRKCAEQERLSNQRIVDIERLLARSGESQDPRAILDGRPTDDHDALRKEHVELRSKITKLRAAAKAFERDLQTAIGLATNEVARPVAEAHAAIAMAIATKLQELKVLAENERAVLNLLSAKGYTSAGLQSAMPPILDESTLEWAIREAHNEARASVRRSTIPVATQVAV